MPGTYVLYTDGASRGNPGPAGIGAALYRNEGRELVSVGTVSRSIGVTTNNVAEYRAVLAGLELAARHHPDRLVLRADSQLLVRQIEGSYRVRAPGLRPLFAEVTERLGRFAAVEVQHVPREENAVADRLANDALDR